MGILANNVPLLFYAKKLGVSFSNTLTLGRMGYFATKKDILHSMAKYGTQAKDLAEVTFTDGFAEPLFEMLGAVKVDSMDYSDYEKATILHDLNNPLPAHLHGVYSLVFDGGTLEHVFNFPEAIRSGMLAVRKGGHYIGITPANNQMGHGFYQFSPELYFRIFSEENGFRVIKMLISVGEKLDDVKWFEVSDPQVVQSRVSLVNDFPLFLVVIAEKVDDKPIFRITPQQSDYQATWTDHKDLAAGPKSTGRKALSIYRKWMPKRVKIVLRNTYDLFTREKEIIAGLGEVKGGHFSPIDI